jgi:serine/threonine protein kinase
MKRPITVLDRYEILDEIGSSASTHVYRARDTELDRSVALKELRPAPYNYTTCVKQFRHEAKLLARLDHPHIVKIYNVHEKQGRLFIITRLVDGPDLQELIAKQGRLSWPKVLHISAAVVEGLDCAHQQRILHQNLKPANILIDRQHGPMLSDFGLNKLVVQSSTRLTSSGDIVGPAHYIAPEVWEGQGASRQSDIYALGCILYEMLTGDQAFKGKTAAQVVKAHFSPLRLTEEWPEDVPVDVASVLETAMAKNPGDRFDRVSEMAKALPVSIDTDIPEIVVAPKRANATPSTESPPHRAKPDIPQIPEPVIPTATTIEPRQRFETTDQEKELLPDGQNEANGSLVVPGFELPDSQIQSKVSPKMTSREGTGSPTRPLLIGGAIVGLVVSVLCLLAVGGFFAMGFLAPSNDRAIATATSAPNAAAEVEADGTDPENVQELDANGSTPSQPTPGDGDTAGKVIVFADYFDSDASGWATGEFEDDLSQTKVDIEGGKYTLSVTTRPGQTPFVEKKLPNQEFSNFVLSVEATPHDIAEYYSYGVAFRENSADHCYAFEIGNDGLYGVSLFEGDWVTLKDWSSSEAIKVGQKNTLTVVAEGSKLSFFVNEEKLATIEDGTLATGSVGLIVNIFEEGNSATVDFDNLIVTTPP